MDEPFDALLELNERAVVCDRQDAAMNLGADWITLRSVEPRIGRQLLEAQRDALLLFVELEHLDLDLVADVHQIAGVGETAPAHIGNMEQTVDSAKINE